MWSLSQIAIIPAIPEPKVYNTNSVWKGLPVAHPICVATLTARIVCPIKFQIPSNPISITTKYNKIRLLSCILE